MKSQNTYFLLLFFIVSFFLFVFQIGVIPHLYFDELHYIPSATQWLHGVPTKNIEHPLLGKLIMAFFIHILGDNYLGWRMGSVLFGCVSIVFVYKIALVVFKEKSIAILIGFYSLFNFWFFVQSRVAMIDIFMVGFFLAALLAQLHFYESQKKIDLYLSAFFWGCSFACKWSIFIFFIPCLVALFIHLWRKQNRHGFFKSAFSFLLIFAGVYYLSFAPYLFIETEVKLKWYEIFFSMPLRMLELQKSVGGTHVYESKWYTWPLMLRPIWYEFKWNQGEDYFQGIQMIGNPLQMFLGLLSCLGIVVGWRRIKNPLTKELFIIFITSYVAWALIPRKMSYFYYFFPSAVLYSFLVPMSGQLFLSKKNLKVFLFIMVVLSLGFFIYFYPILSGSYAPNEWRSLWYWYKGWI